MALVWQPRNPFQLALTALGVAAGYCGFAFIGTVLSVPPSGFAIIWPATAFLIAVLMLTPARLWWVYVASVVPSHILINLLFEPTPVSVLLTQIGGNFALAFATVFALRTTKGDPLDFGDFRTLLRFVLIAGVAAPAVVNSLTLLVHLANGRTTDYWLSWRQWMVAGIYPTVTITPVLVLAFQRALTGRSPRRKVLLELALITAAIFVLSLFVFGGNFGEMESWPALLLAPMPLLLWAGVRLGTGGTGVGLIAFGGALIAQALQRQGPFGAHAPVEDVVSLQVFLIAVSVPLMLFAALMEERQRTEKLLRRSESRMAVVAAAMEAGLWQWDERSKELWVTEHCKRMFGLPPNAAVIPEMFLQAVHAEDRATVTRAMRESLTMPDTAPSEFRIVRPDGEVRWFIATTHTDFDRHGNAVLVSGMFQDLAQRIDAQGEVEHLTRRLLTLQDEERRSIARELHDSTAQHLVAADLTVSAVKRRVDVPEDAGRMLEDIGNLLREALKEIRTFTFLLQPPELEGEDLSAVLTRYVDGFGRRTGLKTTLRISPVADELSPEQRRAVLRVVQEGLTNVHRHAGATMVVVNLRCINGRMHLVISDDGQGTRRLFERPTGERMLGVGIPGMTARIRQLGGKIEIRSRGGGTTVHVAVPLGDEDEPDVVKAGA